jgi:hypothetical protein
VEKVYEYRYIPNFEEVFFLEKTVPWENIQAEKCMPVPIDSQLKIRLFSLYFSTAQTHFFVIC